MNKMFLKKIYCKIIIFISFILLSLFIFISTAIQTHKNSSFVSQSSNSQFYASNRETLENDDLDTQYISYPPEILFALAPIDKLIPLDPSEFPENFGEFYIKLLNYQTWNAIAWNKTNDYTSAFMKIFNWYKTKFVIPRYLKDFPISSRNLLMNVNDKLDDNNLQTQFKKINSIPIPPSELQGVAFKYIIPNVLNVLDQNFINSNTSVFPRLQNFDYKIVSIDLTKLEATNSFVELEYTYNGNQKYRIFINNKDNLFSTKNITINHLLKNGNIFFRHANKKHDGISSPENLLSLNLSFAKKDKKINLYTSIKNASDYAILKVKSFPNDWKEAISIGLLESPILPQHITTAINVGTNYRFVPQNRISQFAGYSEKNDYTIISTTPKSKRTFSITFYMAKNEKIEIPIFYKNKRISGAASISLSTNEECELTTKTPSLKIPGNDYQADVKPIKINNRKGHENGKTWVEIEIVTDENIIVGSKDFRSTPQNLVPGEFDLKFYNSNQKDIIFEKPFDFLGPQQELLIDYTKIFDSANETAKLIGQTYYSAWGIYREPKFDVSGNLQEINVPEVIEPIFNNKLSYTNSSTRIFSNEKKPHNKNIVQNNFGKLIEDINDYSNVLNQVIKDISGDNLFFGYNKDYLKPTLKMQEQKFVNNVLLSTNQNQLVKKAFSEIQLATEVFVNGPLALEDVTKENHPLGIANVQKSDRKKWLEFALPRIEIITKNRYQTLFSNFEAKILDYKYQMINELLESSDINLNNNFDGISQGLIKKQIMQIGLKQQEMMILNNVEQKIQTYKTFKEQLISILEMLQNHSIVVKIIGKKQVYDFKKQVKILLSTKTKRDNDKRIVLQVTKSLFKIIDYLAHHNKYSLFSILMINQHIQDKTKRLMIMISIFNNAVANLVKIEKVPIVAYAIKAIINNRKINVAIFNIKKIFDSFLAKKNLNSLATKKIKEFKNYDYWSDPNKLAEIAVKIRQYNLKKFFNDITKNDLKGVAQKILKLNPLLELPNNLPPQSKFVDIIKSASQNSEILFSIIGFMLLTSCSIIMIIGYRNRKILSNRSKIIIGIGLVSIALLIIISSFLLPIVALPLVT